MAPADHYLGIGKDFCDYLGRGAVCILPVNSNLHLLLFSYLKGTSCSKTLSPFGSTTIEWPLDDFITALLTEMVVVQESSIQIIYNGKCGVFTMPAPGFPRSISSGYCTFRSSSLSFISCLPASHSASNMAFTTGCMRSMVCKKVRIPTALMPSACCSVL